MVCLGGGPSLTAADVEYCRGRDVRMLAVNDAYHIAPFADVLYACDGKWWDYHQGVPSFTGLKFGMTVKAGKWPGVQRLANTGGQGYESQPGGLRTGGNSGFQAVQLAVHLGAVRILLLGYDMQRGKKGRSHWFGEHPLPIRVSSDYGVFCAYFRSLATPLKALGIQVINCSRETALTCFPRMAIDEALQAVAA
jgi:hypothetical protein